MSSYRRASFADRFFDRQRREILARVRHEQQLRRQRRGAVALAAAALVVTVLVFAVIGSPFRPPSESLALLDSIDVPASAVSSDGPLGAFGPWEAAPLLAEGLGSGREPALPTLATPDDDQESNDPLRWLGPFDPSALTASPLPERG